MLLMENTCDTGLWMLGCINGGESHTELVCLLSPGSRHSKVESLCVASPRTSGPAKMSRSVSVLSSLSLPHTLSQRVDARQLSPGSEHMWCQSHAWTQINTEHIRFCSKHKLSWVALYVSLRYRFQCCFSAGKNTQGHLFKTSLAETPVFLSVFRRPLALRRKAAV